MFNLPRDRICPIEAVNMRLAPEPHPFEMTNFAAIENNWCAEKQANPALFDGVMMLASSLGYARGRLEGRCHAVRFATFMHWRRHRRTDLAEHVFAHAMLVTTDNALVAVRMGPHTANPGRVYFAAGSLEPEDFSDGKADLHFNMAREVREETGISLDAARREDKQHFLSNDSTTVVFRRYFLGQNAEEAAERIRAFVAGEDNPEIEGPVLIRHAADIPDRLMPHMRPLIAWHFATMP